MGWALPEVVTTSAGALAAGSCGAGPPLVLALGWPWSSLSWHRLIPQAGFTELPGLGHLPQLEGPQQVCDILHCFLDAA